MLLNENETSILWSICKDAIREAEKLRKEYAEDEWLVDYYRQQKALAEKLQDFLEPLDTIKIEEGPF